MKFKILQDTPLYGKISELLTRMGYCSDEALKLAEKVGAINPVTTNRFRAGGIDGFKFAYTNFPDKLLWLQVDRHNNRDLFYPRSGKKYKENDKLHVQIKSLPVVTIEEYNDVVKFEPQWIGLTQYRSYGITKGDGYYLIEIGQGCDYNPVEGMIEILGSEFDKLKKDADAFNKE